MNAQSIAAKKLRLDLEQKNKKKKNQTQRKKTEKKTPRRRRELKCFEHGRGSRIEFWQKGAGGVGEWESRWVKGGHIHDNKESLLDFLFGKVPSND